LFDPRMPDARQATALLGRDMGGGLAAAEPNGLDTLLHCWRRHVRRRRNARLRACFLRDRLVISTKRPRGWTRRTERAIERPSIDLVEGRTGIVNRPSISDHFERVDHVLILDDRGVARNGATRGTRLDPASQPFSELLRTGCPGALA